MQRMKQIARAVIYVMVVVSLLPLAAYVIVSFPAVQQKILARLNKTLSEAMHAEVTVGHLRLRPGFGITASDVCIKVWGDTIIYTQEISTGIEEIDLRKKIFHFEKTTLTKAFFHLIEDSVKQQTNIDVIVDALEGKDDNEESPSTFLLFEGIKLTGGSYQMTMNHRPIAQQGIDFDHLHVSNINARLNYLKIFKGKVYLQARNLSFIEQSGFMVNRMNFTMRITNEDMHFDQVVITTPYSDLHATHLYFNANFDRYADFMEKVDLDYLFTRSHLGIQDLSYFVPSLRHQQQKFSFSGHFQGTVSNLRIKTIRLQYNQHTLVEMKGSLNGLPDIAHTYSYLSIQHLQTCYEDLQRLLPLFLNTADVTLPPLLKQFGDLIYKGQYTGFINDFVAYGHFFTGAGNVATDVMIKPGENLLSLQGIVQTESFDAGILFQQPLLRTITMNLQVNGSLDQKKQQWNASMDGNISSLHFKNYNYTGIQLNGAIKEKSFQGAVVIDDPNLQLEFNGNIDFSKNLPQYHFDASIKNANLYRLNFFSRQDSTLSFDTEVKADFQGNINHLNGSLSILNARFSKTGSLYLLKNVLLNFTGSADSAATESVELISDIMDVHIKGRYDIHSLVDATRDMLYLYLPHLMPHYSYPQALPSGNQFTFTVFLKNTGHFTEFFFPDLHLAENTFINGTFHAGTNDINLAASGNFFSYGSLHLNNFTFFSATRDSMWEVNLGCDELKAGEQFHFKQFFLSCEMNNNNISTDLTWKEDTSSVREHFSCHTTIDVNPFTRNPIFFIGIDSSSFTLMHEKWDIGKSRIQIDSNVIVFNSFTLHRGNQTFEATGKISPSPSDTFTLRFNNFPINTINWFVDKQSITLDGMANGYIHLQNIYSRPVIFCNADVSDLTVNNEKLGDASLSAQWDENEKKIMVQSSIFHKGYAPVAEIKGFYSPSQQHLNFLISLNKFKIRPLEMYLQGVLSNVNGFATGQMTLTGSTADPLLNGKINIQRGTFTVDYLRTTYFFTDPVYIENNRFILHQATLSDENGKEASVNASLLARHFKDYFIDITINANDFNLLNTREKDNPYFYGQAYGTGQIKISGTPSNLAITVNATTDKNTWIKIPFNTGEIEEKKFITFVNKKDESSSSDFSAQRIIRTSTTSGLTLKLAIETTPEAKIQLILDPIIGDAITATGKGNIQLQIDDLGKFNMYGQYIIEEGEYRFSLKQLIVKYFKIDRGGIIEWHGDPVDATIDVKAIYRTRASLAGVLPDDQGQTSAAKIPVECWLYLSGKLLNPTLRYDIYLPNATEETRTRLNSILTPDELPRQFIWLLATSTFYTDPSRMPSHTASTAPSASTNASYDILSSQLNNLLGKNAWDVGMMLSSSNLEIGVSRQLLNDRVSITGSLDYYGNPSTGTTGYPPVSPIQNKILGDIDLDVKITDDGKFRFKAFNRANTDQYAYNLYDQALHKQGVGLMYHEEFNSFSELLSSYWQKLTGKKKKTK